MILVPAPGALVTLLVGAGGAAPAVVPVAAKGDAGRVEEPSLVVLAASGFGAVPKNLDTAFPGVVGVCGQAQGTDR